MIQLRTRERQLCNRIILITRKGFQFQFNQLIIIFMKIVLLTLLIITNCIFLTPDQLTARFNQFVSNRSLMGFAIEISANSQTVYKGNFGIRDFARQLPITNDTMFRMASLSKSITASGIFLLIEEGKIKLTDTIDQLLGFNAINHNFPNIPITLEMVLSHQSSLIECSAYDNWLDDTYSAASGYQVPKLQDLFTKGNKYYNECTFSKTRRPGTYFDYVNLNFVIAGTIIEKISGIRFDLFMRERLLSKFSDSMNFNPALIPNQNDLAVLYIGSSGQWVARQDDIKGHVDQRNLTGYVIGTNGGIYGPQGSVRASVTDLKKYINILRENGVYQDKVILKPQSVAQIIRPRYQYHGNLFGGYNDFHAYGFGISTSTYRKNDNIWKHKAVIGHHGDAYGLISAYYYYGDYAITYAINGALYGYKFTSDSIYELQRQIIANLTQEFLFGS